MNETNVAILGGTGNLGAGLALRWAAAGVSVVIGSRDAERARSTAQDFTERLPASAATIEGVDNSSAAEAADIVIVAVPFDSASKMIESVAAKLSGKTVVSTVVPLGFDAQGPYVLSLETHSSVAEDLASRVPRARLVAGFHSVAAAALTDLSQPVDEDILLCGDDDPSLAEVAKLIRLIPGASPVVAGPLRLAGALEGFTAALIGVNKRNRAHVGLRLARLPAALRAP